MSTNFKTLLSLIALGAFFVSATAMADYRDYNDKAWNSLYKRSHSVATSRVDRTTAPVIARSEAAPEKIAQAPSTARAYSYEPAQIAGSSTPCTGKAAPAASTAQKATSNRSFSYEPGATYIAPAVRYGSSGGGNSYQNAMRAKGY
jgi:hypothetical protein